MTVISLSASILVVAALCAMSVAFARRVEPGVKLPMQWGFDRRPTWYAPRAVALGFTPVLAALIMTPLAVGFAWTDAADAAAPIGILGLIGAAFVVAHVLHLGLLNRWLRAQ